MSGRGGNAAVVVNRDARWSDFDPEAYFEHYYGEPHADDDALTTLAARALRKAGADRPGGLDVVDVGTGPSLIPFLCALPVARRLTAWEFAPANLSWLAHEIMGRHLRPQWQHFWGVVKAAHGGEHTVASPLMAHDPLPRLAACSRLVRGSIFDLPRHAYDAGTMFFCAESITGSAEEFDAALKAFVGTVRPGGMIAAAFLVRSSGYDVAGRRYPAIDLGADEIAARMARHLATLDATPIGLSDREIRSGYSGSLFVAGRTPAA